MTRGYMKFSLFRILIMSFAFLNLHQLTDSTECAALLAHVGRRSGPLFAPIDEVVDVVRVAVCEWYGNYFVLSPFLPIPTVT